MASPPVVTYARLSLVLAEGRDLSMRARLRLEGSLLRECRQCRCHCPRLGYLADFRASRVMHDFPIS